MNRIAKAMFSGLMVVCSLVLADTVIDATKAEAWPKSIKPVANGVLESKSPTSRIATLKYIDIDTKKVYKISGDFRIEGPLAGKKIGLYFGFVPYTAQNKPLQTPTVYTLAFPLATVAKPVEANATEIVLKGAEAWKIPPKHMKLAFDAKADKSDLPNYKLSPSVKGDYKKNDDGTITLTLVSPIKTAVPTGTIVRAHMDGGTYIYTGSASKPVTNEWTTYSGTITGVGNCNALSRWWPHAAKAYVIFFAGNPAPKGCTLQFRNVKVEEITK